MQIGEGIAKAGKTSGSPPPPGEEEQTVAASLRFVEIRGLYQPGFDDGTHRDDGSGYGCGYQVGYTSSDDRGRVFVNHRPRASASEPWADARAKDVQYIEMIVQVQTNGALPATVEIEWSWEDPDDPSDASMHAAAKRHIDPNGDRNNDNRGTCDYAPARGSRRPAFEAVSGFTMTGSGSTCRTAIASNESRVRLHLTNVGGDNFRVTARVVGVHGTTVVTTGTMTMWKRIDVEYHQMQSVWLVPVADVVRAFEPAFIQLDFTAAIDLAFTTELPGTRSVEAESWSLTQRLFRHARQPGWFLLVAAHLDTTAARGTSHPPDYAGPGFLHSVPGGQMLLIPDPFLGSDGRPAIAGAVKLVNGNESLTFRCLGRTAPDGAAPGYTGIWLDALRYYNVVEGGDGSYAHAHSRPNEYLPMAQAGFQGLGFSTEVDCQVFAGEVMGQSGITPLDHRVGRPSFVGRSIVFMGRFDSADESLQTIVHELCHGFGFAHSCGRTAADPSSQRACTMAVLNYWVFRPGTGTLQRWHHPPRHAEFCEYHLRGLRHAHLEDYDRLWRW